MHKSFLKIATLLGALTVALGAFAAHTIKAKVTPDVLNIFETGVRYQMYHTIGLFIAAMLYKEFPTKNIIWAGNFFIAGIIIFSGSLYVLTFIKAINATNLLWVGAITPFGGVAFIVAWCLLFYEFCKKSII
jgi:uncharacterized membrane protein YgdD (TMEM256/DUF423 family)